MTSSEPAEPVAVAPAVGSVAAEEINEIGDLGVAELVLFEPSIPSLATHALGGPPTTRGALARTSTRSSMRSSNCFSFRMVSALVTRETWEESVHLRL